jgi:hypothetical protein
VAPLLKLCLILLKVATSINGLPFPVEGITLSDQISITEEFVASFLDDTSEKVLNAMNSAIDQKTIEHSKCVELRPLVGVAYEAIARESYKPKNSQWKECMIPVVNHAGDLIWVKKEYKSLYD